MNTDTFRDDLNTPTEADLDACYGSKYLSATEVGDRKIKTRIARVRKEALQQQGGATRNKFVLGCATLDKEIVLNSTNKTLLSRILAGILPTGSARRLEFTRNQPRMPANQPGACVCACSTGQ